MKLIQEAVKTTYDNNAVTPAICIDQPGRSGGTLLSGWTPNPVGPVNQLVDPSYEWNDSGYKHLENECLHWFFERQVDRAPDRVAV